MARLQGPDVFGNILHVQLAVEIGGQPHGGVTHEELNLLDGMSPAHLFTEGVAEGMGRSIFSPFLVTSGRLCQRGAVADRCEVAFLEAVMNDSYTSRVAWPCRGEMPRAAATSS